MDMDKQGKELADLVLDHMNQLTDKAELLDSNNRYTDIISNHIRNMQSLRQRLLSLAARGEY